MEIDKAREIITRCDNAIARSSRLKFYPLVIESARGVRVKDINGKEYLDVCGHWAVANTGYSHSKILAAVKDQIEKISAFCSISFYNEIVTRCAEKLIQITPGDFPKKVVYGHSGSDANECVFKILQYALKRPRFISFIGSYHGQTMGSYSVSGHHAQTAFVSLPGVVKLPYPYCYRCPFGLEYSICGLQCIEYIKYVLKNIAPGESVAGVFVEPIEADGGDIVPPPEFHRELKRITEEYGIMFVSDEVKVGFGRTGKMFGIENYGVVPDIMTMGKPIASGFPMSACVGRAEILDSGEGLHMFTTAGSPVACAAALATLEVIEGQNLLDNAKDMGDYFLKKLKRVMERHELVGDVRGKGLILGIELVKDRKTKEPAPKEVSKVVYRAWELGLITVTTGLYSNVIEITPPLILAKNDIDEAVEIIEMAISDVKKGIVSDEVIKDYGGW